MKALGELFFNPITARRALLGGISRIDFQTQPIGAFCLIGRVLNRLIPCRIRDAFGELGGFHHPLNIQVLKDRNLKHIYQVT